MIGPSRPIQPHRDGLGPVAIQAPALIPASWMAAPLCGSQ